VNRFIFGRGWVYQDEATDGTDGGAGGAATVDTGGEEGAAGTVDDKVDDAAAGAVDDKKPAADGQPKDMLEAITKGLAKTAPTVDEEAEPAKKATDEAAAAAAAPAKTEKHANGAPKKDAAGNELDDNGAIVKKAEAPKAKTAAELELKPDEKKVLGAKAQARFGEVITTLKAREAEIATLTEQMKPLAEAREAITGLLKETMTTPDQLSAYLEFNRLLQSADTKDLETALTMIENQRVVLYKALGREPAGGGVDLLAEFPDLKEKVAEAQMTREAALEVAAARRERAAAEARTKQQTQQQGAAAELKKAQDKGLADITAWTAELTRTDIDYKAKEEKLLDQVDEVIKTYPPNQWLATLKLLYAGIAVTKAAPAPKKGEQPIRPSGAKPGAKAPQNMFEAMWGAEAPK
jgi:hypothetical protein